MSVIATAADCDERQLQVRPRFQSTFYVSLIDPERSSTDDRLRGGFVVRESSQCV
jgi:hypothetical protein